MAKNEYHEIISRYYGRSDTARRLLDVLRQAGINNPDTVTARDLAPFDNLHARGRAWHHRPGETRGLHAGVSRARHRRWHRRTRSYARDGVRLRRHRARSDRGILRSWQNADRSNEAQSRCEFSAGKCPRCAIHRWELRRSLDARLWHEHSTTGASLLGDSPAASSRRSICVPGSNDRSDQFSAFPSSVNSRPGYEFPSVVGRCPGAAATVALPGFGLGVRREPQQRPNADNARGPRLGGTGRRLRPRDIAGGGQHGAESGRGPHPGRSRGVRAGRLTECTPSHHASFAEFAANTSSACSL
jgi:hypothetical protein